MNHRVVLLVLLIVFTLTITTQGIVMAEPTQAKPEVVYVLPIEGAIEPGLAQFVERVLQDAESNNAAVLLEINTFGGRVDAATEIRDLIIRMDVPVISFVRDRAWSAGALITLAAPHVAMAPGSTIGAAEPRPFDEKTVSALRAEFESTAQRSGRDPRIAAAMVDADVEIEGIITEGKILTLSAVLAQENGFADIIASSRSEVLNHFELGDLEIIEFRPNWAETVARWITEPTISQLLLTIGFLGLIFEVTSVGWGVPGTAGILALTLFFGGRLVTGLAGLEVVILFIVGLVLLFSEIFITPGFGVLGGLGIISLFGSIILAYGDTITALYSILIAFFISLLAISLFWNRFTRSGAWRRLVLQTREDKHLGYQGVGAYKELIDKQGVTLTPLRPAGTMELDHKRYDVVSEGGFMDKNAVVKVVTVEGNRIVVREVSN